MRIKRFLKSTANCSSNDFFVLKVTPKGALNRISFVAILKEEVIEWIV